ncbi:MAG: SIMPL domain-containing protein [bacterium]|nr:SIMPL domain-containing protein [bacterium]
MKLDKGIAIVITALIMSMTAIWAVRYQSPLQQEKSLTVEGYGEVKLIPDTLNLNLEITATGSTTQQAQTKMIEMLLGVKEILSGQQIPPQQIKTLNMQVWPDSYWNDGEEKIRRYEASQNLLVQIKGENFQELGATIIAQLPDSGNILLQGVTFSIEDHSAGVQQAREKAFEDAKNQAEHLAKLSGRSLGKVLSITDTNDYNHYDSYPRYTSKSMNYIAAERADAEMVASELVSAGEQEKSHNLSVTFALE